MPTRRFEDSRMTVIGFSGRFSDAARNDELWDLLQFGKDTHRTSPEDCFGREAYCNDSVATKNTSKVGYGQFVKKPGTQSDRSPFFMLTLT